jgi:hypothetical protein
MTVYTTIPDTDINPDKPIKSETGYALRDNPLAIAEGDPTAPSINPAALLIGGKGGDGIFDDATPALTASGFYEFSEMDIAVSRALPLCSVIRIAGNSTLAATLTVPIRTSASVEAIRLQRRELEYLMRAQFGHGNDDYSGVTGSCAGYGYNTPSIANNEYTLNPSALKDWWVQLIPILGGNSSLIGGGGNIIIIVEGDLDCTGGTISAAGGGAVSGAAGGQILVICTGTITNGTFNANGNSAPGATAGGGGGIVKLVASGYIGTQTMNVLGGMQGTFHGDPGYSNKQTLTRDQIRTMLQRA